MMKFRKFLKMAEKRPKNVKSQNLKLPQLNDFSLSILLDNGTEITESDLKIGFIEIHQDKIIVYFNSNVNSGRIRKGRNYKVVYEKIGNQVKFKKIEEI